MDSVSIQNLMKGQTFHADKASNGSGRVVARDGKVVAEMRNGLDVSPLVESLNRSGKLQLPDVTLIIIETQEYELGALAIKDCLRHADFGDVLIFTDKVEPWGALDRIARFVMVPNWDSKLGWSRFSWHNMHPHMQTSHILHIQWDSWIVDPSAWREEFLDYDLIGAPWWYGDGLDVGNLGFSLRSKRILQFMAEHQAEFPINTAVDDDLVCRTYRRRLEEHGFTWAPESIAEMFSFECLRPTLVTQHVFGFHAMFNWPKVLQFELMRDRLNIVMKSPYLRRSGHLQALVNTMTEHALYRVKLYESLTQQADEGRYFNAVGLMRYEDYKLGFEAYECRFKTKWFKEASVILKMFEEEGVPQWRGEPLAGKSILVWHEQGFGDSILMQRFLPMLEKMADNVYVGVPEPLEELFRCNGHNANHLFPTKDEDITLFEYDYHCPMFSLPLAFNLTRENVPAPCLVAPDTGPTIERTSGRPLIGLTWMASTKFPLNDRRSLKFPQFQKFLDPRADYIAIQYELPEEEEAEYLAGGVRKIQYSNFGELAHILTQCDLIIAVCSSTMNLAGSLRVPSWVILCHDMFRDMRWGRTGDDPPWYPGVRVFRQRDVETWEPVLEEVRDALCRFVG